MKSKPDEHEVALFREAIRGVRPLVHATRVMGPEAKPRPLARFSRTAAVPVPETGPHGGADEPPLAAGDRSFFARPGVPAASLRRLRRGQYPVEVELDLHGLTATEAETQLREFLGAALRRNVRSLRIVHGKGLRSGSRGAVLRQLVNSALRRTAPVLAFASARQIDGGTGALYVLLGATHASSASTAD